MAAAKTRVLVVDDSALIRQMIVDNLSATSDLQAVATAENGDQAVEVFGRMEVDVVTLDIQMPKRDGLQTLDALLAIRPVPVIMVSSQTRLGADITLDALERGALDCIAKPDNRHSAQQTLGDDLLRKIRSVAGTDVRRVLAARQQRATERRLRRETAASAMHATSCAPSPALDLANKCIVLGVSTGGPPALAGLFEALVPPLPPIVVVQHMPPHFTRQLAARLDGLSRLSIKEAATGDVLEPNGVYIAPGGHHLELRRHGRGAKLVVRDGAPVSGHRPSIDVMMTSAAEVFSANCLGVIMTGMGRDGADGCRHVRAAGGYVLGQDEATSDVYGMNRVAMLEGHVDRQFALDDAAIVLMQQAKRLWWPQLAGV
jgi:two-component system chemotaxis response regulator CheB